MTRITAKEIGRRSKQREGRLHRKYPEVHSASMRVRFTRSAGIGQNEIRGSGIWRMRDGLPAEKGSTTKATAHNWNANARAAHCTVGAWLVVMQA
jgi:hypothetical protein